MNYCVRLFLLFSLLACQRAKEKPVDSTDGKLKSVMEYRYDPIGNRNSFEHSQSISKNSFIDKQLFNNEGKLVVESRFDSNGNLIGKAVYKYDNNGNNTQLDFYKSSGAMESRVSSRFSSDNKLTQRLESNSENQIIGKQIVSIDSNGNKIITTYKRSEGKFPKTLESVFDRRDRNIANHYFTNEVLKSKNSYLYNANGERLYDAYLTNSIQEIESAFDKYSSFTDDYTYDGVLKRSEEHEYDAGGNRIKTIQYFPLTKRQIISQYKYDKNKIEVTILTASLMVSSKKTFLFDDKNNLIESFRYGIGGLPEEHQKDLYEYDRRGNWVNHKTIVNNKAISIIVRQIEYY